MDIISESEIGKNRIAHDGTLRGYLKSLHELLGSEVAQVAESAANTSFSLTSDAQDDLAAMSDITSKLTLALLKVKGSKKKLSEEEQDSYDRISLLAGTLGNLQDRVNRIIKLSKQINELNIQMKESAIGLAEEVMETQGKFRNIRSAINDYGLLSEDPELSLYLNEKITSVDSL